MAKLLPKDAYPAPRLALTAGDRDRLATLWEARDVDGIFELFRTLGVPVPIGVYRAHVSADDERWREAERDVLDVLAG